VDINLKAFRACHAPVDLRRRHAPFHLHSMVVILLFSLVGCRSDRPQPAPTFAETIAPIVYRNCAVCHRPGEAGPFPLLTYEDVVRKAKTIVAVTKARYMPPWPADPAYSHFLGERILSESDIQSIATWVENGTPLGDPAKAPKPPEFASSSLGVPDLVVKMREPITLPGDNTDHFLVIKLPYEIPEDRFVRAIEFVPGNRKADASHERSHRSVRRPKEGSLRRPLQCRPAESQNS
jgi:hypothetical protein